MGFLIIRRFNKPAAVILQAVGTGILIKNTLNILKTEGENDGFR